MFVGGIKNDVIVAAELDSTSLFDNWHEQMQEANEDAGARALCYDQQIEYLSQLVPQGAVLLDVGCGPNTPYGRLSGRTVIGIEPSFPSVARNKDVDVRIFGSATNLPLQDRSVDAIACFYSIHHMVGTTVSENRDVLDKVFSEFSRVVKPGGQILIFEVTPWTLAGWFQHLIWNVARRKIGSGLNMYFWPARNLKELGKKYLPGAEFKRHIFKVSPFLSIAPVFNINWLKIPRFLYPFRPSLYRWRMPLPL